MNLIRYICGMKVETATHIRTVYLTEEFVRFYNSLPKEVQKKYDYTLDIVQRIYVLPTKFVKHLSGTRLHEIRVAVGSNAYRTVLFAANSNNIIQATEIYLLNSFLKKSEKDYKEQLTIAEKILNELNL